MSTTTAATEIPKFRHQAFYESFADLDRAAAEAGYEKKPKGPGTFVFERTPGPCPEHNGAHVWWTQKMSYSYVGGFGQKAGYSTYSHS